jgi:catechol 1,2-dioxygenase
MPEYSVAQLLDHVNSSYSKPGNERVRQIAERMIADIYRVIVDFNVSHAELWSFFTWLNELGTAKQAGLVGAGIGLERLLDILADEADQHAQRALGTPRAIEGPLYIPHAPLSKHEARLDDGSETGEPLVMEGTVRNTQGQAIPQAIVDVWHAGQGGGYSFFDPSLQAFNYRRRIETDEQGHYLFRSLLPPGYGVPPDSPTQQLLDVLGRHGSRPAHIHFMISAKNHVTLTTQVNIPGDPYLNDDFAFATRDALVVDLQKMTDPKQIAQYRQHGPFTYIAFDFTLQVADEGLPKNS